MTLSDADRLLLADCLLEYDALMARIAMFDQAIRKQLEAFTEPCLLLQTIPGIDEVSAGAIIAEIGPDLQAFGSPHRLAAWAGLCPGNNESAGKRRSCRTRSGSKTLRAVLAECAHGAARTRHCQFSGYHRVLTARRGYKRAIIATAHKMLRTLYAVLRDRKPYRDPGADYEALLVQRNAPRWIRMLRQHGFLQPQLPVTAPA